MDEVKGKNPKTDNQAWRKRPRKFAPKSRLGCKTCKIRRVKCDVTRPSCLKCQSTGRTCDGYTEISPDLKTEIEPKQYRNEKVNRVEGHCGYRDCSAIRACKPDQWHMRYSGLILQNIGPLMILPVTGSGQAEAMRFFEYISIKHLNEYHPCESWRESIMLFSQTVPAVRHAAIALALIYRNYLDGDSSSFMHQSRSLEGYLPDRAPLFHYNRAIQLLLSQETTDRTETTAITLLVCYLFICFDHLAGNYVQAIKHLRGGLELSLGINEATLNSNSNTPGDTQSSGVNTLIYQVTTQIRRLDMQAVTFLVDWTPTNIQEISIDQLPPSHSGFRSLDQAANCLQILVARVMGLHNSEQQMSPMGELPTPPSSFKDTVVAQLETWSSLFENLLQRSSYPTDPKTHPLVSLLRLQHTIAWILLNTTGSGKEMEYDNFLPLFQRCIALANEVAAAHKRYSRSQKPTFTPEVGIVPVLYIVGVKCRHPVVRREALGILRRQPIQEAVWNSIYAARVVERVVEVEEGRFDQGERIQSMGQIAVWHRIEALSWVHVVGRQTAARLDISYTFCTREAMHIESLTI